MIRILYFARLREQLGCAEEQYELPASVTTLAELIAQLRQRGGVWQVALGEQAALMVARNQTLTHLDDPVADGDEIALFPPVTGG